MKLKFKCTVTFEIESDTRYYDTDVVSEMIKIDEDQLNENVYLLLDVMGNSTPQVKLELIEQGGEYNAKA